MTEQLGIPGFGHTRIIPHAGAYAAPPGGGPKGETCRTCAYSLGVQRARTYWKCRLIDWTFGKATDIRLSAPACRRWSVQDGD